MHRNDRFRRASCNNFEFLVATKSELKNFAWLRRKGLCQLVSVWPGFSYAENTLMKNSRRDKTGFAILSSRQTQFLQLIAEGYLTREIAGLLRISDKTAEKHRQSLMDKLDIHEVATLTRFAVSTGVIAADRAPSQPAMAA
jgi:DNA-binding CsgD family transcriptional regulator